MRHKHTNVHKNDIANINNVELRQLDLMNEKCYLNITIAFTIEFTNANTFANTRQIGRKQIGKQMERQMKTQLKIQLKTTNINIQTYTII